MRVQVVLFDAVGTLFGVRGSVGAIYSELAVAFGVQSDPEVVENRFRRAFAARRAATTDARGWWRAVVGESLPEMPRSDFDAYYERVWDYFATAAAWTLYPDTQPTLAQLTAQGLRLAVVSNFDARLYPVLAALGLAQFFETVVLSSEVGYAKPNPRLFAAALHRLDAPAETTLHVGDAAEDVIGAEAAGIRALRLLREGASGAGAIASLADLLALPELAR